MKFVIIGAGISGLYLGTELLKRGVNVVIVENTKRVGGKIDSKKYLQYTYEAGAGRFSSSDTTLLHLLEIYGLSSKIKSIGGYNKQLEPYYKEIVNSIKENKLDLSQISTQSYLDTLFSYRDFSSKYGYDGDIIESSALCGLNILLSDYYSENYYVLLGGLGQLVDKIKRHFLSLGGKLMLHKKITEIYRSHSGYRIIGPTLNLDCDRLVLAIPPKSLARLYPTKPQFSFTKYITPIPLLRVYFMYSKPQVQLRGLKKIVSNLDIRFIIPINEHIIMISYTDNKLARMWNSLYKKDREEFYSKILGEFYTTTGITLGIPDRESIEYWDAGVHVWKPGFNYIENYKNILQPLSNLYLCNEAYSKNQGWIQGGLSMANDILRII
jgi:monoamine oxidase